MEQSAMHDMSATENVHEIGLLEINPDEIVKELEKTMTSKPVYNDTKSLFDVTLNLGDESPSSDSISAELHENLDDLVVERQNWDYFVQNIKTKPTKDQVSYKPSEQQAAYLAQGPNLQQFVSGFKDFMSTAIEFKDEMRQVQSLTEDLKARCLHHVNARQREVVYKHSADKMHK
ncbi:Kmn1 [Drosophila busckii]|uniref:Kmn1 n=1 Tax=Drosophila busckii TaxID=30019 RepID=A0A0M4F7M8_DROBS|nr:uncharacterized protein LOC108605970 [Drosophila busckii]ALC48225.1 Kmn1 [Drosophila busckii]